MASKVPVADVLQQLRLAGYDGPVAAYKEGRVHQYMMLAGGSDDSDDSDDEYSKYQRPPAELEGNAAAVEEWVVRIFAQDQLIAPRRKQLEVCAVAVGVTAIRNQLLCQQSFVML